MWRKQKEKWRGKPVGVGKLMGSTECNFCAVQGCGKSRFGTQCPRTTHQEHLANFLKGQWCKMLGCRTVMDRFGQRRRKRVWAYVRHSSGHTCLERGIWYIFSTAFYLPADEHPSCSLECSPAALRAGRICFCIIHHYVSFSCHCWKK